MYIYFRQIAKKTVKKKLHKHLQTKKKILYVVQYWNFIDRLYWNLPYCSDLMKIIKDQPPVHTWCISTRFLQFKCICVLPLKYRRGSVTDFKLWNDASRRMLYGYHYSYAIINNVIDVADNRIENLFQRKTQKWIKVHSIQSWFPILM